MDRTLVVKFGGTSVGSVPALSQAVENVRRAGADWPRQVVVVSALSGVTDRLLSTARSALDGAPDLATAVTDIEHGHVQLLEALISSEENRRQIRERLAALLQEFASLCGAIQILGEATPRALDAVASIGERLSAQIVSGALRSAGLPSIPVEATRLIVTDANYQEARPDFESTTGRTRDVLLPMLDEALIPVVTGFIGATPSGVTTTLGRGGSDYSAAILGTVLPADEVWIWTDVDGVMTADPRMVEGAQTIARLTYREVAELAYFGAKVLHPKTIRPVVEAGISLRVLNSFAPESPGTLVVSNSEPDEGGALKAVTAFQGQKLVTIEGRGMLGVPGVAARAFRAVADTGTSVILITQASSEQSICFAVPSAAASQVLPALEATFAAELAHRDIDRIWSTEDTAIVTVVGTGMRDTPGVAGKIFTALGQCGVNVIAIAQGSSEVAISLVVSQEDVEAAVSALHALIVPEEI